MYTLHSVIDQFVQELANIFDENEGVPVFDSCWKSFQLELALEEIIFGHPVLKSDFHLSVSLGTNIHIDPSQWVHWVSPTHRCQCS